MLSTDWLEHIRKKEDTDCFGWILTHSTHTFYVLNIVLSSKDIGWVRASPLSLRNLYSNVEAQDT